MLDGYVNIDVLVKSDEEDDDCVPNGIGITIDGDDFEQIWENSGDPGGVFIAYRPDYNLRVTAMMSPDGDVEMQASRQVTIHQNHLQLRTEGLPDQIGI